MSTRRYIAALALIAITGIAAVRARAADIRIMCYSDGNECEATETLATHFMKDNPDIKVIIDKVPYKSILESLPVQLAAGNGPDVARVTIAGPIMQYSLDLTPYLKDPKYWEDNFGSMLPWLRPNAQDRGIYGMPTQLTVTGPIVNKTLFEQANVPMPGPTATWDDWTVAVARVAKATKTPFGMAWDRSGHRFAGPAISYGAKYFTAGGKPDVVNEGFKAMASRFVKWNQDGTVDKGVWAAAGGGSYRDAFEEFANGQIVLYLSGSWQLSRLQKQVGDAFDWVAVPNPCGPAGCSGMPGGASFVAFKQTKSPKEVARFLDWLASGPVYAEYMSMTSNIPALASLQHGGVKYNLSPAANAALDAFVGNATTISPVAYQLQGYRLSGSIFTTTVDRLSQAINGQLTLDQAYQRITSDMADAIAAAATK
jgi:alpha-1,4-digalacturonate transport system substrate-binding protein